MITQKRIKTVLILATVLAVLAAFGGPLQAAVVLYEPFDYPADFLDGVATNATGLTGNWTAGSITGINAGSMWLPAHLTTAGGKLKVTTTNDSAEAYAYVALDTTAFTGLLDDGDVLWFGMIASTSGTVTGNALRFQIGNDEDNNVGFLMDQATIDDTRVRALATEGGTESLAATFATPSGGGNIYVLGKITFGVTDKVEIWLPDLLGDLELIGAPVSTIETTLDQTTMDWLQININNGNSNQRCDEIRIGETFQDAGGTIDEDRPDVDAGPDMVNWSGNTLQLAAEVTSHDTGDLTYDWYADPNDGVAFNPQGAEPWTSIVEDPEITITRGTGDPTIVTLTLSVNNVGAARTDTPDEMKIELYDNACDAAILGTIASFALGDLDDDCLTGLTDIAAMSAAWEDDYSLTAPVPKP